MSTYLWWRDNLPRPRPYSALGYGRADAFSSYLSNMTGEDCIELYRLGRCQFVTEKTKSHPYLTRAEIALDSTIPLSH